MNNMLLFDSDSDTDSETDSDNGDAKGDPDDILTFYCGQRSWKIPRHRFVSESDNGKYFFKSIADVPLEIRVDFPYQLTDEQYARLVRYFVDGTDPNTFVEYIFGHPWTVFEQWANMKFK